MKSKLLKDISHFLGVLMAVVLVMTYTSCSDEDTTDTTGFAPVSYTHLTLPTT